MNSQSQPPVPEGGRTREPITSKVAFVMPVYNEGATIANTVLELYQKTLRLMPNSKVMLFEDGSKDNTKAVVETLARNHPWVEVHTSGARKGYPKAAQDAICSVDDWAYEYILFMDSDGQYDPDDFFTLWDSMSNGSPQPDIVMGRRNRRAEPNYRVFLSSGLRVLENVLFSPACTDITSAFRLMRTSIAKEIARQVKYSKHSFWLEFTARTSQGGYKVVETGVSYRSRAGEAGAKSNVYSPRRMPGILANELGTVFRTWLEYRQVQLAKFLAVGASGAIVILMLTYALTTWLGMFYALSAGIGIEVSIIWAFFLNDRWTFRGLDVRRDLLSRLGRYNLISFSGLVINEAVLIALVNVFHWYYLAGEVAGIVCAAAFNFLANIRWTWR